MSLSKNLNQSWVMKATILNYPGPPGSWGRVRFVDSKGVTTLPYRLVMTGRDRRYQLKYNPMKLYYASKPRHKALDVALGYALDVEILSPCRRGSNGVTFTPGTLRLTDINGANVYTFWEAVLLPGRYMLQRNGVIRQANDNQQTAIEKAIADAN